MKYFRTPWFLISIAMIAIIVVYSLFQKLKSSNDSVITKKNAIINRGLSEHENEQLQYGKDLIAHTALYLGPKGSVAKVSNGMNCQNCHINGGKQQYGNSFFAVASTYPRFRPRSGKVESIEFRVNDCLQRSLNGKVIEDSSNEMKAMVAYIKSVGADYKTDAAIKGAGTEELSFLKRAADPRKGKVIYYSKCVSCHGANGEGVPSADHSYYTYPPLWGEHSYNVSAGIYRLSKLAGFIKNNMPFGTTFKNPQLNNEEAWDVASFINSQPRSSIMFAVDWPDISAKPVDYPFGPYVDPYNEKQHKYGPFQELVDAKKGKELFKRSK